MITTTFSRLHANQACKNRYRHLAKAIGGVRSYGKHTPITLLQIIDHNGIDDALWSLRACEPVNEVEGLARRFVVRCVRETPLVGGRMLWDLLTDERSRAVVETAER